MSAQTLINTLADTARVAGRTLSIATGAERKAALESIADAIEARSAEILAANEMNMSSHLDGRLQFTYLLNSLRPRNRYEKWLKNRVSQEVKDVSEYYGYNITKAKEALKILSDEDLKIIHTKLEKVV